MIIKPPHVDKAVDGKGGGHPSDVLPPFCVCLGLSVRQTDRVGDRHGQYQSVTARPGSHRAHQLGHDLLLFRTFDKINRYHRADFHIVRTSSFITSVSIASTHVKRTFAIRLSAFKFPFYSMRSSSSTSLTECKIACLSKVG